MTSALQESTANVDEWKRQLQSYKEENARIKAKYADLEAGKIAEGNSEALRLRVEALESELRTRNEEIKALTMANKNKDFVVSIYIYRAFLIPYRYSLLMLMLTTFRSFD